MGTYQSKYTGAEIDSKLDEVGQIATAEVLGGIKVGEGLEITEDGILNVLASGGSSYSETSLLSSPINYGFTASGQKQINTNLTLVGNINDYDELVIKMGKLNNYNGQFQLLPTHEVHILVSEIVYNNSDTRAFDGSFLTWKLPNETNYILNAWFKNQNTLRIYSTQTSLTGDVTYDHFRIMAIKGIKY